MILAEGGLESSWQRHMKNHLALKADLEAMGLTFVMPETERLPQLNLVSIPGGVDEASVHNQLLQQYTLEIGVGLGTLAGKVRRIGPMGYAGNPKNFFLCVNALEAVLPQYNADINCGAATATVEAVYS